MTERTAEKAAEERRIFYVAMTRARERLLLSGAANFASWSEASPLAWIAPALVPDLRERTARGEGGVHCIEGAGGVPVRLTLSSAAARSGILGRDGARAADSGSPLAAAAAAAGAAPPPRVASPAAPDTLSYTSLAEYERCGYRYYLQRVLGLPDAAPPADRAAPGISADARGTIVHALLERVDFARPTPPGPADIRRAAADLGLVITADADLEEITQLVAAVAASPLCGRLAGARDVRREAPFAFTLDGHSVLLRGAIDVVGAEAGGALLVVDYKSDRLGDGESPAQRVERDYAVQRLVYALAALQLGATGVEVAHCFLRRPGDAASTRYGAQDRRRLESELAQRLAPLDAGRFEMPATRTGSCVRPVRVAPDCVRTRSHSRSATRRRSGLRSGLCSLRSDLGW